MSSLLTHFLECGVVSNVDVNVSMKFLVPFFSPDDVTLVLMYNTTWS